MEDVSGRTLALLGGRARLTGTAPRHSDRRATLLLTHRPVDVLLAPGNSQEPMKSLSIFPFRIYLFLFANGHLGLSISLSVSLPLSVCLFVMTAPLKINNWKSDEVDGVDRYCGWDNHNP